VESGTLNSPEIEIAWAAGFYDGEGCSTLSKKGKNSHVRCAISQKDRRVLDRFRNTVGFGKIYPSKGTCPWRWQTTSELDSRRVLELLWPYLGELKKEQANEVLTQSTWHDGVKKQLKCKNIEHEVILQKGRRRCRTCQREYMKKYFAKHKLTKTMV
jgi:hypothetical protein